MNIAGTTGYPHVRYGRAAFGSFLRSTNTVLAATM